MKRRNFISNTALAAIGITAALTVSCNTKPNDAEPESKDTSTKDDFE